MKIAIIKERRTGENRVSMSPQVAANLIKMGFEVWVESDAGLGAHFSNTHYTEAGAKIKAFNELNDADVFVQINPPSPEIIQAIPDGKIWISSIYHRSNLELTESLNDDKY